ncbi:LPXTG cell wall anchor domain-containing protein [Marininema halotolerans]|uniref:LPXTG-motif cell wall anchor domain-containing protein n=1 Tax=Marininema halotolerans TaxID=1155944 RepID=A0A1I6S4R9_9BACL|nr:LPXTG cell wall anchor domain-containing protein [Marininema halotolerans]SFS71936.1 LPXTG-motif cell wall anchor domain-containing protein [Marininema halotolerans]
MRRGWFVVLTAMALLWSLVAPGVVSADGDPVLSVTTEQKADELAVKASVSGEKVEEGHYTFTIGEDKKESENGEVSFKGLSNGKHQLDVTFKGKVDGQEKELANKVDVAITATTDEQPKADEPAAGNEDGTKADDKKGDKKDGEDATKPGDKKDQDEKKPQEMSLGFYPEIYDNYVEVQSAIIDGDFNLIDAKQVKGTWKIKFKGQAESVYKEVTDSGLRVTEGFIVEHPGTHDVRVSFKGKVDGKKVNLAEVFTFSFPKASIKLNFDGKDTLGAQLTNAKEAEGSWFVVVESMDSEDVYYDYESDVKKGLRFSHKLKDLKPGKYWVWAGFEGSVDGYDGGLFNSIEITIKKDGTVTVDNDGEGGKTAGGTTSEKMDKIVKDIKQGGKMPKTASDLPMFTLLGGVLLAAGLLLLKRKPAQD